MTQSISWTQECNSCKGTGLYVGLAERDGAAVICHRCEGTGQRHETVEYEPFTGRKEKDGVTRVFATAAGIVLSPEITSGGVPLAEWEADGQSPYQAGVELRSHTCPAWWYQSTNYALKPDWKECQNVGQFSTCSSFPSKDKCWERWDKENKEPKE